MTLYQTEIPTMGNVALRSGKLIPRMLWKVLHKKCR